MPLFSRGAADGLEGGWARRIEERLTADRADLLAERNLLAQTGVEFQIRGVRYSRAQIQASAQARLGRMQRDQSTVDAKKQSVERLDEAIRDGRAQLQAAVTARDQEVQELELLSADLANAELPRELVSLAEPLRHGCSLARSGSELSESLKSFAERVVVGGRIRAGDQESVFCDGRGGRTGERPAGG